MVRLIIALAVVVVVARFARADVAPSGMFGDHMVLQRGMPVPVWGSAEPGEKVTVSFAGQTATAETDPTGKWKLALPAMEASADGRELVIEGKNKVVIKDVLVGEVWVCSGQSNMQYGWGTSSHPMFNWGGDAEIAALAEKASGKPIRSFDVRPNVAWEPTDQIQGAWSAGPSGSAVAFGFSYHLHEELGVPVAVIVTCWGSSSIEGWMPRDLGEQLPHFKAMVDGLRSSEQAKPRIDAAIARGIRHGNVFVRKQPNILYNAMLHPILPYACRGFVWYQGEANENDPAQYARSLPLWIERLRQGWAQPEMTFLLVMLPGFGQDDGTPTAKSWAPMREAQMGALQLKHTAVANTIDLGDAKNIHPADKAPICTRLALLARKDVYGQDVVARGPTFKQSRVDGATMVIEFDHAEGLKTTDGTAPAGFWLQDESQKWHPADATIEGTTVKLQAPGVQKPAACRYAYSGKPKVNLVNGGGLPTYPFRTDEGK